MLRLNELEDHIAIVAKTIDMRTIKTIHAIFTLILLALLLIAPILLSAH